MYKYNIQIKELEVAAQLTVFYFLYAKGRQNCNLKQLGGGRNLTHLCRLVSLSSNKQSIKMKLDIWNAVLKLDVFILEAFVFS